MGLVANFVQDWYTLQQIMSGIVLGMVIFWYFMPESPRWLLSKNNKYQEAIKVLTNGAKYNRRPLPEGFLRYDDGTFKVHSLYYIGSENFCLRTFYHKAFLLQDME